MNEKVLDRDANTLSVNDKVLIVANGMRLEGVINNISPEGVLKVFTTNGTFKRRSDEVTRLFL